MIIPDDINPTYTNRDTLDAQVFVTQRQKLFMLNKLAIKYPSIVSWVVVNIYPANPSIDYRFEENFADYAVLVSYDWHPSGKGCTNSSCYETYPKGYMCSYNDPVTLYPSGEFTDVVACQPACYLKKRHQKLYSAIPYDKSLVDDEKPDRCVECDENWLQRKTYDFTRRRLINGRYDLYDWTTGRTRTDDLPKSNAETKLEDKNDAGYPKTSPDLPQLYWDGETRKCILVNNPIFRTVTEPYWGDKSHSKCRVTNFVHGNDIVFGFRPEHIGEIDPRDLGFLVKNSRTYCRAFNKELRENGNCELSLLNQILSYTLAGETMLNIVRDAFSGQWSCADDMWRPIKGERSNEVDVKSVDGGNATYRQWRANVNLQFVLPPTNVKLSDLGIDVRVTGNRLYWNNVEGVISHFAMFKTIEQLVGTGLLEEGGTTEVSPESGVSTGGRRRERDIDVDRTEREKESERRLREFRHDAFLSRYRNYNDAAALDETEARSGEDESRTRESGDEREESLGELHDRIEELMSRLKSMYDEKAERLRERYAVEGTRGLREVVISREDEEKDARIVKETNLLSAMLNRYERKMVGGRGRPAEVLLRKKRENGGSGTGGFTGSSGGGQSGTFSVGNFEENEADRLSTIFLSYYLKDDEKRDEKSEDGGTSEGAEGKEEEEGKKRKRRAATMGSRKESDLAEIADHINEMKNRSPWLDLIKELGIGVAEQILETKFRKILGHAFKRTIVALAKAVSGTISKSVLKVGLRVGIAKIIGFAASRIASQLLVIASTFASGVGILVSAIQIIALLLDLAFLAGWDPGNYKAETDIAVYESIANFFTYAKQQQGGVDLRCDILMLTLYTVDDNKDGDATNQGEGSATEKPKTTTATDSSSSDSARSKRSAEKSQTRDEASPNDPTRHFRNTLPRRTTKSSSASTLSDDAKGAAKSKKRKELGDQAMNVDDLISRPRWFNKKFTLCFEEDSSTRLNIIDEKELFTMIYGFYFLGHYHYNSFGQEIKRDEEAMDLNDATLSDIMIETDYRDLLTTSSKRNVDATAYNARVAVNTRLLRYLFAAVVALAALYVFGTIRKSSVLLDLTIFSLILVLIVASILFVLRLVLPIDDSFVEKYNSALYGGGSGESIEVNANGRGNGTTYDMGNYLFENENQKRPTARAKSETNGQASSSDSKIPTLVDLSSKLDALLRNL